MNKNIDLTNILKDCPKGTKLYSSTLGDVTLKKINNGVIYPIIVSCYDGTLSESFTADGKMIKDKGECTLFPAKDQRNWNEFKAPWYKKEKFDPKTLKPFDKVLACFTEQSTWCCGLFSYFAEDANLIVCCGDAYYKYCIPYNDETKHLVGTTDEAPEFYKYWEE